MSIVNGRGRWNPESRLRTRHPIDRAFQEQFPTERCQDSLTCVRCGALVRPGSWIGSIEHDGHRDRACYSCYKDFQAERLGRPRDRPIDRSVKVTHHDPDPHAALRAVEDLAQVNSSDAALPPRHFWQVDAEGLHWEGDLTQDSTGHLFLSLTAESPEHDGYVLTLDAQGDQTAGSLVPRILARALRESLDIEVPRTQSPAQERMTAAFPKSGQKWVAADDELLDQLVEDGAWMTDWRRLQRSPRAVWMRMQFRGLVPPDEEMPSTWVQIQAAVSSPAQED